MLRAFTSQAWLQPAARRAQPIGKNKFLPSKEFRSKRGARTPNLKAVKLGLFEKRGQKLVQASDLKAAAVKLRPGERRKLIALADEVRGFKIVSLPTLKRMKPVATALSAAVMLATGIAELAAARKLGRRFRRK